VADELLPDRARGVEVVALAEQLERHRARARDGARVRRLGARDQAQQRRLAVAVAADDADPVARADAERDVAQDRAERGVALAGAAQVDEVAGPAHTARSTESSSPGKRASRSARRSEFSRAVPRWRWEITPASRSTLKWWVHVDLVTGRSKAPQAGCSSVPARAATMRRRIGSLSACST